MADMKVGSKAELKIEKKGAAKQPWTAKKIATTLIIAILALLMVGGSFWSLFSMNSNRNAFGFYDGEPIVYEANNTFGKTLMSDEAYIQAYMSGDYNQLWTSWYRAYQTHVLFVAIDQIAKNAGITAPVELVKDMIIKSGAYSNESGEFDPAKYEETPVAERQSHFDYAKTLYPYQLVLSDMATIIPSKGESDFVAELNHNLRDFSYFSLDYSVYPSELAKQYILDNARLFDSLDISIISCNSEEKINKAYDALKAGKAWNDVVKEYSEDNYATNNGDVGTPMYASILQSNLKNPEDIEKVTTLNYGEYTAPIQGPYSFSIYRLNDIPVLASTEDEDLVDHVKAYIYTNNKEEVTPYMDTALAGASALVDSDFDAAAEQYSAGIISVKGANGNSGKSQFLLGMQYSDPRAELALAVDGDADLSRKLFTEKVGTIVGPIKQENSTLFARIDSTEGENAMSDMMKQYYDYYKAQLIMLDMRNNIINSDKHEDKFAEKFFEMFLKNQTQEQPQA